jgi:hypothetical protein
MKQDLQNPVRFIFFDEELITGYTVTRGRWIFIFENMMTLVDLVESVNQNLNNAPHVNGW